MSSSLAEYLHKDRYSLAKIMINIPQVRITVDELISFLYPQRGLGSRNLSDIQSDLFELKRRFNQYLISLSVLDSSLNESKEEIVDRFFESLPSVAKLLDLDVCAAFQGDPAAYSKEEVIVSYPGFYAVCVYRMANVLYKLNVPLLPRIMSEYAHEKTGIDIHPGATIGESFFIDHGTGVVIGETSIIGKNVKIYQGVTLGALSVKKNLQSKKRHPTIEDDVVIYANSTILGGDTIVGRNSVVGGNVWLTESVPEGSVILNKAEISKTIKSTK